MHNPRNNLAIQFSVLSFPLLEHSARGVASHLEVFAIYVTARFYLSLLILCSITAFWRNILGKRTWVMPGEEWSLNIKVWVNVLGGHSTVHSPHVVIGLLSMLLAAAAVMRGIPRTLRARPQTPFRNSRFLWQTTGRLMRSSSARSRASGGGPLLRSS
ncbi:hypothetical protein B0H13DRAFT_2679118 [Mycena leptocephala]|nr:hypothetical protein B0H13DRAFT_2679118 [Mycena leptocephala]